MLIKTPVQILQEARDYLAEDGWTVGILNADDNGKLQTCAIGALAFILNDNKMPNDTEDAIDIVEDRDGEAVEALWKALTPDTVKYNGTRIESIILFNDKQDSVGPILDLFDRAIASFT